MINSIVFTAPLSNDAVDTTDIGGGFECLFHANVGGKNGTVWVTCYFRGRKAENIFTGLTKGATVCVHGALAPRDPEMHGSVIINARDVVVMGREDRTP